MGIKIRFGRKILQVVDEVTISWNIVRQSHYRGYFGGKFEIEFEEVI
jgi:hypothetical protein